MHETDIDNDDSVVVLHATWVRNGGEYVCGCWCEGEGGEPFDAEVTAAALELAGVEGVDDGEAFWAELLLPGRKGAPLPSTPLLGEAQGRGKPGLVAVEVELLLLAPAQAAALFLGLSGGVSLPTGIVAGVDFFYWGEVCRWAIGFLVRQDLVPVLSQEHGHWRSRWLPLFKGGAVQTFSGLARAMTPAMLAGVAGEDGWSLVSAGRLLLRAVYDLADAMARDAIAGLHFSDPAENRDHSVHDAWLADLLTGQQALSVPVAGPPPEVEEEHLEEIGLSPRVVVCLGRNDIDTLHELLIQPPEDLLALPGFGQRALADVETTLSAMGLSLARHDSGSRRRPTMDFDGFAEQLNGWFAPLTAEAWSGFRLCLRLEEPGEDSETWLLRFLLQAVDEPSLLVAAEEVWQADPAAAQFFERRFDRPRERLLTTLGRASRLFPPLRQGLKNGTPAGCELDGEGAYGFLKEASWLLEEDGFGVLLPAWWANRGRRPALSARARIAGPDLGKGPVGLGDPLAFDWQMALGDQPLSLAELKRLAKLKAPLVRTSGRWLELNPEEIKAALTFWKNKKDRRLSLREVLALGLGDTADIDGVRFAGLDTEGWLAELLAGLKSGERLQPVAQPPGLAARLRPYQERGLAWLAFLAKWGLGSCLADDMGLGKTIQSLALVLHRQAQGEARPVLLVCPTSVLGNWQREAARFAPELTVYVHHGSERLRGEALAEAAVGGQLVLTSFGLALRDREDLAAVDWSGVIVDEAQNIKNPKTRQARAIRSLGAGYRLAMTGTPVENSVGDLWSLMEFMNPGYLGSQAGFKRRFFLPIQVRGDREATERLKRLTGPFVLRRLKSDKTVIADLPDKMEMNAYVSLTDEQASLYQAVVDEVGDDLGRASGMERKGLILATILRLKQICNHPAHFLGDGSTLSGRSGKFDRLIELLEVVRAAGDSALIFTQFTAMGDLLRKYLTSLYRREIFYLHGGVSRTKRDRMVVEFQESDEAEIMILSLRAGGTGLNLTKAAHVFHFDRWWNPAVEDQATDRAYRIGQTVNVQVRKFVCQGTVEERIDTMINAKKDLSAKIVTSGEGWLTELSTDELCDLFRLERR